MSLPQWAPPRKPHRLGLWAPFGLLLIGVIALSVVWFWMRGEVEREMEGARTAAVSSGWKLDWGRRSITGFPFRMDVTLQDVQVREPSGWGLAAPNLKAEAFIFAPTHWVAVAPSGVVIARRRGGPLYVGAKALRASLSEITNAPPRISIEGLGLTFTTPPGAAQFWLRSAGEFHFHTKSGPDDQGAAYLEFDGAQAQLGGLLGRIADGRPALLIVDGIYSHAHSLSGASWLEAARRWGQGGGHLDVRQLRLAAGTAELVARKGQLSVGADGRLVGQLDLTFQQAPRTLDAMGAQGVMTPEAARAAVALAGAVRQGPSVSLPLAFQAGRTTLGPIAIGPAPRVY